MQTHSPKRWNWRRRADISRISSRPALYSWCPPVSRYPRSEKRFKYRPPYCYYCIIIVSIILLILPAVGRAPCIVLPRYIQTCAQSRCTPPAFAPPLSCRVHVAPRYQSSCVLAGWWGSLTGWEEDSRPSTVRNVFGCIHLTYTWVKQTTNSRWFGEEKGAADLTSQRGWLVHRAAICLQFSATAARF